MLHLPMAVTTLEPGSQSSDADGGLTKHYLKEEEMAGKDSSGAA